MSTAPNSLTLITDLARQLTPGILAASPRSVRSLLSELQANQALFRAIASALLAFIPQASKTSLDALANFLVDPDVVKELAQPLNGALPNSHELAVIYSDLTRQPPTAEMNFDHGVVAYAATFASALRHEPALRNLASLAQDQDALRAKLQLPDDVQRHLDAATVQISTLLNKPNVNTLNANDIHAQNVVVGVQQIIHQHFYTPRALQWEEHYLRTLIARCDPLDLLPLSETQVDEQGRPLQSVGISDVFTTLNLNNLRRAPEQTLDDIAQHIVTINVLLPPMDRRDVSVFVSDRSFQGSTTKTASSANLRQGTNRSNQRDDPSDDAIPIQAIEAVAASSRLVILGQPGGGKSSLVNHLAVQLARRRLRTAFADERLPGWPAQMQPIPIKIVVREFAEWLSQQTSKTDVWAYIAHLLTQWGCVECLPELKAQIINESGLILFDGLDEVRAEVRADDAAALRETIKNAITEFAAPLPRAKVVLTCREYAYQPPNPWEDRPDWRLPVEVFPVVTLAPLTPEQIDQFIHDWYRITGPLLPLFWEASRCSEEANSLSSNIRDAARPYLMDLAENPLLLTLMAQVNGRGGELPNDRADLYERAVKLLLDRWEARLERDASGGRLRVPSVYQQLGISPEGLTIALQEVAYTAHAQQGQETGRATDRRAANISEPLLLQQLKRHLKDDYGLAQRAVQFIQTRAGLLVAYAGETYSFPHRTFQEYLAARHIMRLADPAATLRELLSADLAWWREVFLLAAGTQRNQPSLIRGLIEALLIDIPDGEILVNSWAKLLLAEQAMHETRFADEATREPRTAQPGPFTQVVNSTRRVLLRAMQSPLGLAAKERAQAGDALARLGDPRFDPDRFYLPAEDDLGFTHIPADPRFKIGTRQNDFERVMEAIGAEKDKWGEWRDEINDVVTPSPECYIARYPVTVAQWRAFVEDMRRTDADFKIGDERSLQGVDNHPAIYVSWHEALLYCDWLTEQIKTLKASRLSSQEILRVCELLRSGQWLITLPSELTWEKAAKGDKDTIFGYGEEPDPGKANFSAQSSIDDTSPVGCYAPNPFGYYDLIGNVLEWTRSKYARYPYRPEDGREALTGDARRVLRGGSWVNNHQGARVAYRFHVTPDYRYNDVGFRVVCAPVFPLPSSGSL